MTTNELEAGKWIKATLEEYDTEHRAYLDIIPEVAGLPNYRYQVQRRNDVRTVNQHIAISVYHFLVVATVQGQTIESGPNGLVAMAENITAALHRNNGETAKAKIGACTRVETYGNTETVGGDIIRHAGAIFEVIVYGIPESE